MTNKTTGQRVVQDDSCVVRDNQGDQGRQGTLVWDRYLHDNSWPVLKTRFIKDRIFKQCLFNVVLKLHSMC